MVRCRRVHGLVPALLGVLLGCGSAEDATPAAQPVTSPTPPTAPEVTETDVAEEADAATPSAAAAAEPAALTEIGYTEIPAQPEAALMRLNAMIARSRWRW